MLRKESNSGSIQDLAHIVSEYCLSDSLTKHSAKPDALVSAVTTGIIKNVDVHPAFRTLIKHKAFFAVWAVNFLDTPRMVLSVLGEYMYDEIQEAYYCH